MSKKSKIVAAIVCCGVVLVTLLIYLSVTGGDHVVVYTSVDQVYSEKIFDAYERATGIKVKAVYDIEATKTVGLVNRLISEKNKPVADVFWNGEILQTINLKHSGVLESVELENSTELPDAFVDSDGEWYGFGGRARVVIYNRTLISAQECPAIMKEFGIGALAEHTGLAYPIFGTSSTHSAVLYALWGEDAAKDYFTDINAAGIKILDGNGPVKDYVSSGSLWLGLTDTDDALSEMKTNSDLDILFLDQGDEDAGALVIPNTVAKIKGGPNPEQAVAFMEFLLSAEVEQMLVDDNWIQIPVHSGVDADPIIEAMNIKIMDVDFEEAFGYAEEAKTDLTSIFIR